MHRRYPQGAPVPQVNPGPCSLTFDLPQPEPVRHAQDGCRPISHARPGRACVDQLAGAAGNREAACGNPGVFVGGALRPLADPATHRTGGTAPRFRTPDTPCVSSTARLDYRGSSSGHRGSACTSDTLRRAYVSVSSCLLSCRTVAHGLCGPVVHGAARSKCVSYRITPAFAGGTIADPLP